MRHLIDRLLYTRLGAQRDALLEQLRGEVDAIRKLTRPRLARDAGVGVVV